MLNIVDEFTRESLTIEVARKFKSKDVVAVLADIQYIRRLGLILRQYQVRRVAYEACKQYTRCGSPVRLVELDCALPVATNKL